MNRPLKIKMETVSKLKKHKTCMTIELCGDARTYFCNVNQVLCPGDQALLVYNEKGARKCSCVAVVAVKRNRGGLVRKDFDVLAKSHELSTSMMNSLWNCFKSRVLDVPQADILLKIDGITQNDVKTIQGISDEFYRDENAYGRIKRFDLSLNTIQTLITNTIFTDGGLKAVADIIDEDPYLLADTIDQFKLIDTMCSLKPAFGSDKRRRVRSAARLCMEKLLLNSLATCVPMREVHEMMRQKLAVETSLQDIDKEFLGQKTCREGVVVCERHNVVYTTMTFASETRIANCINSLIGSDVGTETMRDEEEDEEWLANFTMHQRSAVRQFHNATFSIVDGAAGTGKSTCIAEMAQSVASNNETVVLMAPTGKAVNRLNETIRAIKMPQSLSAFVKVCTVHAFYYNWEKYREYKDRQQERGYEDQKEEFAWRGTSHYVVDEASMLSFEHGRMLAKIWDSLKKSSLHVTLVGDRNQLRPIGRGCLFEQLLDSERVKAFTTRLTDVKRNEGGIVTLATDIIRGTLPQTLPSLASVEWDKYGNLTHEQLVKHVLKIFAQSESIHAKDDFVVVCRGKRMVNDLNGRLREMIHSSQTRLKQVKFNDNMAFAEGDRVMHTQQNDYSRKLMNGDTGVVRDVDVDNGTFTVDYSGNRVNYTVNDDASKDETSPHNLVYAYVTNCHKAQGSEYRDVYVVLEPQFLPGGRRLIYTAITRARRKLVLIVSGYASFCRECESDRGESSTLSYLSDRIDHPVFPKRKRK